jgi:hypothetical protein
VPVVFLLARKWYSSPVSRWSVPFFLAAVLALTACLGTSSGSSTAGISPALVTATAKQDALAVADALEELIASGTDRAEDRQYAYNIVRAKPVDTAAYTYARAVVTGRLVQQRGLLGADLVGDVEHFARRSRELDPNFRTGAATRMLGTLYVIAPPALLRHGDSETGLELLEKLVQSHPDVIENHLRVGEAYIALGDPEPATSHLCRCQAEQQRMRGDDRSLLAQLMKDAGNPKCPPPSAAPPQD